MIKDVLNRFKHSQKRFKAILAHYALRRLLNVY